MRQPENFQCCSQIYNNPFQDDFCDYVEERCIEVWGQREGCNRSNADVADVVRQLRESPFFLQIDNQYNSLNQRSKFPEDQGGGVTYPSPEPCTSVEQQAVWIARLHDKKKKRKKKAAKQRRIFMFHFTLIFLTDYRMFYVLAMEWSSTSLFQHFAFSARERPLFFFLGGGVDLSLPTSSFC